LSIRKCNVTAWPWRLLVFSSGELPAGVAAGVNHAGAYGCLGCHVLPGLALWRCTGLRGNNLRVAEVMDGVMADRGENSAANQTWQRARALRCAFPSPPFVFKTYGRTPIVRINSKARLALSSLMWANRFACSSALGFLVRWYKTMRFRFAA
jgi:hypothetical protein